MKAKVLVDLYIAILARSTRTTTQSITISIISGVADLSIINPFLVIILPYARLLLNLIPQIIKGAGRHSKLPFKLLLQFRRGIWFAGQII